MNELQHTEKQNCDTTKEIKATDDLESNLVIKEVINNNSDIIQSKNVCNAVAVIKCTAPSSNKLVGSSNEMQKTSAIQTINNGCIAKCELTNNEKKKRIKLKRKSIEPCYKDNTFTVLNVPALVFHQPPTKRQRLSRIDIAIINKKMRRQRKCFNICSTPDYSSDSTSESEDECKKVDLWIKSGPPLKPDFAEEKVKFLGGFRLVTHRVRNSIEIQKLQKREWHAPIVIGVPETKELVPLNLPMPSKSPSVLNMMPDFKPKSNFLQILGLQKVPPQIRQEMERIWIKIINERRKRKCESSLTKYSEKVYDKYLLSAKLRTTSSLLGQDLLSRIPIVHRINAAVHLNRNISLSKVEEKPVDDLITKNRFSCIVPNNNLNKAWEKEEIMPKRDSFEWPGVHGIMEAYRKYSKDRETEINQLRKRCSMISNETMMKQTEIKYLEKKQLQLRTTLLTTEEEGRRLKELTEQLKNIINAFR